MQKNKSLTLIVILYTLSLYPIFTGAQVSNENEVYKKLISELRCMVCQNQNLEESEAPYPGMPAAPPNSASERSMVKLPGINCLTNTKEEKH